METDALASSLMQWQENSSEQSRRESERMQKSLDEIKAMLGDQNGRIRENEKAIGVAAASLTTTASALVEVRVSQLDTLKQVSANAVAIASLKTWVALVGTGVGVVGLGAALLQVVH